MLSSTGAGVGAGTGDGVGTGTGDGVGAGTGAGVGSGAGPESRHLFQEVVQSDGTSRLQRRVEDIVG